MIVLVGHVLVQIDHRWALKRLCKKERVQVKNEKARKIFVL